MLPQLSKAAEQLLLSFDYPGNVRQLQNNLERAVILCKGQTIMPEHLSNELVNASNSGESENDGSMTCTKCKEQVIEKFERN